LSTHLPAALTGDGHAVHQARVASRRLRETLPVVGADLDRQDVKKARKRMRKLTRVLGPVRELEVARHMVEGRLEAHPDEKPALDALVAVVGRDLDRARDRLTQTLDDDRIKRWLDQARALEGQVADSQAQATWRRVLGTRLERRAVRLQTALDRAGVLFDPERLHAVRIALKRLRYALELAGELRLASTTAAVRELKGVQDTLGALHDIDVMMGYAERAAEDPDVEGTTRAGLEALHASLETERRSLHAQFLARQPGLHRLHDRALEIVARVQTQRMLRARRPMAPAKKLARA
jgi:CHAD domain-containing protein